MDDWAKAKVTYVPAAYMAVSSSTPDTTCEWMGAAPGSDSSLTHGPCRRTASQQALSGSEATNARATVTARWSSAPSASSPATCLGAITVRTRASSVGRWCRRMGNAMNGGRGGWMGDVPGSAGGAAAAGTGEERVRALGLESCCEVLEDERKRRWRGQVHRLGLHPLRADSPEVEGGGVST
jgi:hypothetical protein